MTAFLVVAALNAGAQEDGCTINVVGSDTMVILGQKWAQEFMKQHPAVNISVTGGGSGTGIAALLNGTASLAQSSRAIKPGEKLDFIKTFKKAPVEVKVALDGLAIYVHNENPIAELTIAQIADIYTGKITNFNQVGGPDQKITIYGREANSGTYVAFKEMVLHNTDFAANTNVLAGTAAVISALTKDPTGIAYGGKGYGQGIKVVKVKKDDASPAIEPTQETVASGEYPIARPLYFYINPTKLPTCIKDWSAWVLSNEGQALVDAAGYFHLPQDIVMASIGAVASMQPGATMEAK